MPLDPQSTEYAKTSSFTAPLGASNGNVAQAVNSQPPQKNRRTAIIIAIIAGALCVAAIITGIVLWQQHNAAEQAIREPHPIALRIVAERYNDTCTKFPITITGTDIDGANVDQTFFVDGAGNGISLTKGSYTMAFPASPLTSDGVLYNPPSATYSLEIGNDLESGAPVDTSLIGDIVYTPTTALEETDEQIQNAYDWACKDPSQKERADELKKVAEQTHANAVADEEKRKADEEAQRKADEERRKAQEEAAAMQRTLAKLNGWWLVAGSSSSSTMYIDDGVAYVYRKDLTSPTYGDDPYVGPLITSTITMERATSPSSGPGYKVTFSDIGGWYFLADNDPDTLTCHWGDSFQNYSGTGTYGRQDGPPGKIEEIS